MRRLSCRGVPWIFYGANNTPSGFRFHVPGTNHLQILRPGQSNPFAFSLKTSRDLRQLAPNGGRRVRVTGVVTQFSPAGNFTLQDDTGAIRAQRLNTILPDDHPKRNAPLVGPQPKPSAGDWTRPSFRPC